MTTRYNNNKYRNRQQITKWRCHPRWQPSRLTIFSFYIETNSSSRYDNFVCSNQILFIAKANTLNCHGERSLGFQSIQKKINQTSRPSIVAIAAVIKLLRGSMSRLNSTLLLIERLNLRGRNEIPYKRQSREDIHHENVDWFMSSVGGKN